MSKIMSKFKIIVIAALLGVVTACATEPSPAKVNFDRNTEIETINYKTFAWLTSGKILAAPVDINPVMKVRIDEEIEQAFTAKGYQLVESAEDADFAISYTVGNRDKIKVTSYPATYRGGFGWGRGYYGAGRGYYGGMGTETRVRSYTEGKLAVDVFDVKSHQPVWHGWGVKRIKSVDKENPNETIRMVVKQVVDQF